MEDQPQSQPLFKRILNKIVAASVTFLFVGLAAVMVWQGTGFIAERANAVVPPEETQAAMVDVATIAMQESFTVKRSFTGQIEAPQTVNIAFETGGVVQQVEFDEGERVARGTVLAVLDDRLQNAELKRLRASKRSLEAQHELAILTNQRQAELEKKGFASSQRADQSRFSVAQLDAQLAEVDAAILAAEIRLEKTIVRAPFDGRVDRRLADPGTTVGAGTSVLSLIEDDRPVFRVGVDPKLVAEIPLGKTVEVRFGNSSEKATIISILPRVDPVTRTLVVRAKLDRETQLSFGLTGELEIDEQITSTGAWVPLTAIEAGVRGLWTIKTVKTIEGEEKQHVRLEAVEIIHADEKRAYVRGTFDKNARYITDGLHRVVAGQTVRVGS